MSILLAIDIGNTQTTLGVYAQAERFIHTQTGSDTLNTNLQSALIFSDNIPTNKAAGVDEISQIYTTLSTYQINTVRIASVVPNLTEVWAAAGIDILKLDAEIITLDSLSDRVKIVFEQPETIGADRLAAALAAKLLYSENKIVVDFGTATNIEVITSSDEFIGGIISPGLETSTAALFNVADKLQTVEIKAPTHLIGQNTAEAVQSGLVLGEATKVDGLVAQIIGSAKLSDVTVIATGGLCELLGPLCKTVDVIDPYFVLKGIVLV